ncbi:MAG TPA: cation:proton antiporter [Burkholderiaceae bacterium]|jgi:Kef-type K+ transport system membrane component KefB
MLSMFMISPDLAWAFALAIAWVVGEIGHRWTGLPRISIYGLVGFLLASSQTGFLPKARDSNLLLVANISFGLILFEVGYRINLHWLRTNAWVGISGLVESIGTFAAVYFLAQWYGVPSIAALLIASLSMSASPAGILRVLNEQGSSGQVTERVLHMSVMSCVMAVFAFKVILGFRVFQTSGSLLDAVWNSFVVLFVSAGLGALFGVTVPILRSKLGNLCTDATVVFAISVILLVALTASFQLSPILATLTFGLVARHRRVTLSRTQRNFGVLGDLLMVPLFVFVASTLHWPQVKTGMLLALLLIGARLLVKTAAITLFAHISGMTWKKGVLTGFALGPISVFVILILEQTRYLDIDMIDYLAPLAAMALLLDLVGPIMTQRALIWASETPDTTEG